MLVIMITNVYTFIIKCNVSILYLYAVSNMFLTFEYIKTISAYQANINFLQSLMLTNI